VAAALQLGRPQCSEDPNCRGEGKAKPGKRKKKRVREQKLEEGLRGMEAPSVVHVYK